MGITTEIEISNELEVITAMMDHQIERLKKNPKLFKARKGSITRSWVDKADEELGSPGKSIDQMQKRPQSTSKLQEVNMIPLKPRRRWSQVLA